MQTNCYCIMYYWYNRTPQSTREEEISSTRGIEKVFMKETNFDPGFE